MAVFIIFSGYLYFCVSFTNRLKKQKASTIIRLSMPFLPVGVTGFEPATTRPPDFEICSLIISDYLYVKCFMALSVYTLVYNSVTATCLYYVNYFSFLFCKDTLEDSPVTCFRSVL